MKARDIMHRGVECIPAHETLERAARRMRELDVGSLPICDHDRLTGMITDRDIVVKCVALGHDPATMTAGDLAQGTPRWIDAGASVQDVLREMKQNQIRRLPVMENKRLIGVISEADLAASLDEGQLAEFVSRVATPHR
ncbi:MAG TPA: CBS domain-containing protein [Actinophytocola sp.]|uniref:CBS domain-containing protein n=1 Tax=Actinophytocola sp. TaxID=1872138 RepID=UPI002DDDA0E3|nr:CBS domain-containing protein [Actinophytocola sp.]HEV2778627.1 CBS domain-containing protein [Actinophytocola sp.]